MPFVAVGMFFHKMLVAGIAPPAGATTPGFLKTMIDYPFALFQKYAWPLASMVLVIMIVYGGIMWMMAGADPGKLAQARKIIVFAVIGFALVMASVLIVTIGASLIGYTGSIGTINTN